MTHRPILTIIATLWLLGADATAQTRSVRHGLVTWQTDDRTAQGIAHSTGRSMLVFHHRPLDTKLDPVLDHPLIADAIEHEFVPLVVSAPEDPRAFSIRDRVGRVITPATLVPDRSALVRLLVTELQRTHRKIPAYLELLMEEELSAKRGVEIAIFGVG